jgi:DNA polymerase II small subunit/DNA polymerase delta subunit B
MQPQQILSDDEEDFFEMANLSPKDTGLPFVVWISSKGGAQHDVRVKVSRGPKATPSDLVSVALRPDIHVVSGTLSGNELKLLQQWIKLNWDVIVAYWEGEIEYTKDALAALKPIR